MSPRAAPAGWGQGVPDSRLNSDLNETPQPGAVIRSPLTVRGQAKGPWYFEGVFPLMLRNSGGKILARGVASAKGEWMTNDFVPFIGKLVFAALEEVSGGLIVVSDF